MHHLGTKALKTPRLLLRKFTLDDAGAMYRNWASDEEVTKYLRWPAHKNKEVSYQILLQWTKDYSNPDFYQWAIVLDDNPEPIGSIGVNYYQEKTELAHIGYCIGWKWWNQGITSEALKRVMNFLFDEVGMKRIESLHDPNNPHSGAVMKKCGMRYEGTLRNADWNNQGICDACYYGILDSDR